MVWSFISDLFFILHFISHSFAHNSIPLTPSFWPLGELFALCSVCSFIVCCTAWKLTPFNSHRNLININHVCKCFLHLFESEEWKKTWECVICARYFVDFSHTVSNGNENEILTVTKGAKLNRRERIMSIQCQHILISTC